VGKVVLVVVVVLDGAEVGAELVDVDELAEPGPATEELVVELDEGVGL